MVRTRLIECSLFFSTLLFPLVVPAFAAEIMTMPYQYSSDTDVAIDAGETFVLCDCKPSPELAVTPKELGIALKITESLHLPTPVREEPIPAPTTPKTVNADLPPKEAIDPMTLSTPVGEELTPAPPAPNTVSADRRPQEAIGPVIIQFGFNNDQLAQEKEILEGVARIKKLEGKVTVVGHTCDLGSKESNDRLSLARAERVSGFLKKQGVEVAEVMGKGSCCPRSTDRRLNRRVEIFVMQSGGDHEK